MNEQIKRVVEAYAVECQQEAEALLEVLAKIPAPSRQEERRTEFCRNWFLSQGAADVSVDSAKNVLCKIDCDKYHDIVVFVAHMDVVFPDTEPLPYRREGNIIYAPGIGDDTANLVNLMMAAKYLIHSTAKPKVGIMIVANSCEEGLGNSDGSKEIHRVYGPRIIATYSIDGNLGECYNQALGSHRYRVEVATAGGHSYIDYGNTSAIAVLGQMIAEIYQLSVPVDIKTTINVGVIQGGNSVNSIAQSASMLCEYRSLSQEYLRQMEEKFQSIFKKGRGPDVEVFVHLVGVRPGNGDVSKKQMQLLTDHTIGVINAFYDGDILCEEASTDINIPLSMGIAGICIGTISGGKVHTREEWLDVTSLSTGIKIVLSLLLNYTDWEENLPI